MNRVVVLLALLLFSSMAIARKAPLPAPAPTELSLIDSNLESLISESLLAFGRAVVSGDLQKLAHCFIAFYHHHGLEHAALGRVYASHLRGGFEDRPVNALELAAANNQAEVINRLIAHVTKFDDLREWLTEPLMGARLPTALHLAARFNNEDATQALLLAATQDGKWLHALFPDLGHNAPAFITVVEHGSLEMLKAYLEAAKLRPRYAARILGLESTQHNALAIALRDGKEGFILELMRSPFAARFVAGLPKDLEMPEDVRTHHRLWRAITDNLPKEMIGTGFPQHPPRNIRGVNTNSVLTLALVIGLAMLHQQMEHLATHRSH